MRAAAIASSSTFGPSVTVAPNTNSVATATCPAGTPAISGGLITNGIRLFVTDSFKHGNGWAIRVTNTGTSNDSVRAGVVCS